MLIFDAHLDLSMNALEWNRDLTRPIAEVRRREEGRTDKVDRARGTVTLPEMRRGQVGLCVATQIARAVEPGNPLPGWYSPQIAWAQTQGQLAWYRAMEEAGLQPLFGDIDSELEHEVGFLSVRQMLSRGEQVDAIFAGSDATAHGVYDALREAGIRIPGDISVASFNDTAFKGKVAYVSPAVDQTMRTFQAEALVSNDDRRLKPGFFAKGVILTKKDEGVLAVPDTAVSTLAGVSSVYVIRNCKILQQQVTLGVRQGDLWEIVEGLKGDETLANSRLNELATGVTVRTGSGEPIVNAWVLLEGVGAWAVSDRNGRFLMDRLPTGEHHFLARAPDGTEGEATATVPGGVVDIAIGPAPKAPARKRADRK
jgi:multidrug efflux pump subunit AcrA (membrane-fusion protein)